MSYAARALLLTRDVTRSKHSAVISAFNAEFIRPGELPIPLFDLLRVGFEERAESDYGLGEFDAGRADRAVASAREFVQAIASRLSRPA